MQGGCSFLEMPTNILALLGGTAWAARCPPSTAVCRSRNAASRVTSSCVPLGLHPSRFRPSDGITRFPN